MRVPHPAHLRGARVCACARTELARSVSLCVSDSNQCVRSPACSVSLCSTLFMCVPVCVQDAHIPIRICDYGTDLTFLSARDMNEAFED